MLLRLKSDENRPLIQSCEVTEALDRLAICEVVETNLLLTTVSWRNNKLYGIV